MAKGYRIGWPAESIAWQAMSFEYKELGNWHIILDLADFLRVKIPRDSHEAYNPGLWKQFLSEFRRRYRDIRGMWVCRKKSEAVYYYGEYGGDVYEVTYDPGKIVIDLGVDGIFVIKPFSAREIGVVPEKHPSAYRDENPRRLRLPRWVSRNPLRRLSSMYLYHGTNSPEEIGRGLIQPSLTPYASIASSYGDVILVVRIPRESKYEWKARQKPYYVEYVGNIPRAAIRVAVPNTFGMNERAVDQAAKPFPGEAEFSKAMAIGLYLKRQNEFGNPSQRAQGGNPGGFLDQGDRTFIVEVLKPYFGIAKLKIGWSSSKAKWPDLWCETNGIPRIVLTREFQRQSMHERRKRLVHECIHIAWGKDHGMIDGLLYSTYPAKDEYSKAVYQRILKRGNPSPPTKGRGLSKNVMGTRMWKGYEVDIELRDKWLAAVNRIPDYEVRSICTGHTERGKYGVYPAFDGILKWLHGDPRKVIPQALRMKRELLSRLPNTIVSLNFRSGQGGVVYDGAGRRRHAPESPELEALWNKWEHIITDAWFGFYFKVPNMPENQMAIEKWWEAAPSIISDTFRRTKAGWSRNPTLRIEPSMMGSYWAPFKGEIAIGKADPEVVEHMAEVLGHEIGHSRLHTKGYYAVRFPAGKSLTARDKLKHELEAWDWALTKSKAVGIAENLSWIA